MDSKTPLKVLAAEAAGGRHEALAELRMRVEPRLRAVAQEYLPDHGARAGAIEEVLEAVFAAIAVQLRDLVRDEESELDAWLVVQLKQQIVARLMNDYRPRLLGIIRGALPDYLRRDQADEDIWQQVAIVAQSRAETFQWRSEPAFIGYLATIALHQIRDRTAYDQRRKRGGGRRVSDAPCHPGDSGSGGLVEQNFVSNTTPSRRASREELLEKLKKLAKELLTQQEQAILAMFYVEGRRLGDIAAGLGLSEANAKKICSRARTKLAAALGEKSRWMTT